MSGKEPRPFQARSNSLMTAIRRCVDGQVYGPNPEPFFHHTIHRLLVHLDSDGGIEPSLNLAISSLSSGHDKSSPWWGGGHGKYAPILHCWPCGTQQSRATYYALPVRFQTTSRISGRHDLRHGKGWGSSFDTEPCISLNRICGEDESQGVPRHTLCTSVPVPCKNSITSYGVRQ